jgi:endoglycosylceramidase
VAFIFGRHGETAQRLGMPMLVGEWGAYDRHPGTLAPALDIVAQFEALRCSETYWAYLPGTEAFACFRAISRPYPERVAGVLSRYRYDPHTGAFTCAWQEAEAVSAPSRIYFPGWFGFDADALALTPPGDGFEVRETWPGSDSVYVEVPPTGRGDARQLGIRSQ